VDHTIVHFEIPANDLEKLKKFYSDLFGWKFEKFPGPAEYWSIITVPVDEKGMPMRPGLSTTSQSNLWMNTPKKW